MSEESWIQQDRMRYTKNTLSSRLALLAIVLNVLFFVSIYKVNDTHYYTALIGLSILYNLVFMLATFLASEGVKNYKIHFSILLMILAVGQIIRIFIIPSKMFATPIDDKIPLGEIIKITETTTPLEKGAEPIVTVTEVENRVMETSQHIRVIVYLVLSAACLTASAVVNVLKGRALSAHIASLSLQKA